MSKESLLLSQSKTGGISLLSVVLLLTGVVCLVVQVMLLVGGKMDSLAGVSGYITGIVGVVLLGMFAMIGFRKGEVRVYTDHIEGKSKAGRKYSFPLSELSGIDLRSSMLVLKGKDEKTVLADNPPHDSRIRGLIWLLLNHELPIQVWEKYADTTEPTDETWVRLFFNETEEAEFMDRGLLLQVQDRWLYLPIQDTLAAIRRIPGEKSLSTTLQASSMVLKFEPNPGDLPLAQLATALHTTSLDEKMRLSHFEMLVDTHGGTFLQKSEDQWTGETNGWKVLVTNPESVPNDQVREGKD